MNTFKIIGKLDKVDQNAIYLVDNELQLIAVYLSESIKSDLTSNIEKGATIGVEGEIKVNDSELIELHATKLLYMNEQ